MTNTNTTYNYVGVAIATQTIEDMYAAEAAYNRALREYYAAVFTYESNRTPENLMACEAAAKEKKATYAVWSSAIDAFDLANEGGAA
jgi:hypothetical protein